MEECVQNANCTTSSLFGTTRLFLLNVHTVAWLCDFRNKNRSVSCWSLLKNCYME